MNDKGRGTGARIHAEARAHAEERGRAAERRAAWWLRLKGFRILERRYRTPAGEIDLIARRGRLLIFVEVKSRSETADALEAVSTRQRQRISRAAEIYLCRVPPPGEIRFDCILVSPGMRPRHVKDAWRPA